MVIVNNLQSNSRRNIVLEQRCWKKHVNYKNYYDFASKKMIFLIKAVHIPSAYFDS